MNVIQQPTPSSAYTRYPGRPVRGACLHHTATTALYAPQRGKSAHRVFMPDGTIYLQVPLEHAAHTILATDRMRPAWVVRCPDGLVSDANYCTLNYEIVYAPQEPYFQGPTAAQHESVRWALQQDYARFGALPIVGHGELQLDKWPSEPHAFNYFAAGVGPMQPGVGRFLIEEEQVTNPATDEEIKGWLETAGVGVNMDTALIKFAADAFRQGPPPFGNWRGPAIGPGEYAVQLPDGRTVARHRFTAGIAEYDPTTGGLGWVEVVANPDQIEPPV